MRRSMFRAYRRADYALALNFARRLNKSYAVDWEAAFMIAESERHAGSPDTALRLYRRFYRIYPKSTYADDALFWIAEILVKRGNINEAKMLYRRIAKTSSDFATSARERLYDLQSEIPEEPATAP